MQNNSSIFDKIKIGDLIFTRSEDWTGKVIRFVTQSEINHVAIYIGSGKIIESQLGHGVRRFNLQEYLNDKKCEVYLGKLKQIEQKQIEEAIKNAENLLSRPYDLTGQAGILFKIIIVGMGLERLIKFYGKKVSKDKATFWCSELVIHVFALAGAQLTEVDKRFATPEDLARSNNIEFKNLA